MKEIIRFGLIRRFFNRNTLIFNVLLFLVALAAVNIDFLAPVKPEVKVIYLDDSVLEYRQDLMNCDHDDFEYQISNERYDETSAVLHKSQEGWKLYSNLPLDKKTVQAVQEDVSKAVSEYFYRNTDLKTRSILDNYHLLELEQVNEETEEEKSSSALPVVSLIYFLILTYANSLSGEYIYEKNSRTLSLVLSSISPGQYFHGKLISSLLIFLLQGGISLSVGLVMFFIRYRYDRFQGLLGWLGSMDLIKDTGDLSTLHITGGSLVLSGLIILMGLIVIQAFMLVICSSFRNNEDASGFQNIFYLVLMVLYYLSLLYGNDEMYTGYLGGLLSFLPVSQMVFMPCRLLLGAAGQIQGIIALAVHVAFYWSVQGYLSGMLRNNLTKG